MILLSPNSDKKPFISQILQYPVSRAILALVVIFVLGVIFNGEGAFFKWATHRDMLRQSSVYGILACGMTLVIITAGIDLSVGSVLGFSSVLFAILSIHRDWSPWFSIPACIAMGAFLGIISGGAISRFRIQPFIATLAMMVFARGMAKFISGGMKISTSIKQADGSYIYKNEPAIFGFIDSRVLGGDLAVVTLIFVFCLFLSWLILTRFRTGRYLYAIGGNEEAARLSGVPVMKTKIFAYGMCGLFSAIAGICQAAQEYQGDPEAGISYELSAIAIVVIGGTSLMGGRGGILLTLFGALTIGYLEKILSINAVGEAGRLMLTGAIIISAVLLQRGKR
ncbi:MAG: ABC transporter permease [Candidatus Sumerlaeota bacterium]|nr:ABC transporter permease [Candidatus Sumerlaeota bacterium]